jgi:acetyltransferase
MHNERHYLHTLFEPASIAIVGASETPNSIGVTLVRNMLDSGYKGKLFFVNPKHETVFGQKAYASVDTIPQRLDIAVICTKAAIVPEIVDACGRAGCKNAIVISGGFAEAGPRGASLERATLENARRHGMRLLGPNCLGMMRPGSQLNLTFGHGFAHAGTIGLISQSGALCTAILDWALPNNVGFSNVVSLGAESDIDFGEVLDYMVSDPRTENIFLYVEGIKNARRFMSALRAARACKPVLLIKVGRHPGRRKGHPVAYRRPGGRRRRVRRRAAPRRRGAPLQCGPDVRRRIRAVLALPPARQPPGDHHQRRRARRHGRRPCAADIGIPLAQLSAATIAKLNELLPPSWSRATASTSSATPIRSATARPAGLHRRRQRRRRAGDPDAAGDDRPDPGGPHGDRDRKDRPTSRWSPAGWAKSRSREARKLFQGAGIPTFRTPEPAVELFSHISNYYRNQKLLMQTPPSMSDQAPPSPRSARLVIEMALWKRRKVLNEMESKALLAAFRIPIAQTVVARSASEAMVLAEELGLPVVMKIDSPQIVHKSDSGGVRLNLNSLAAVRDAYQEIWTRSRRTAPTHHQRHRHRADDPEAQWPRTGRRHGARQGLRPGDHLSEGGNLRRGHISDRAVALPPLNSYLVADMISLDPHRHGRLGEFRNMPPVNMERAGAGAAARVGDGLRAAVDQRDGDQPADRR